VEVILHSIGPRFCKRYARAEVIVPSMLEVNVPRGNEGTLEFRAAPRRCLVKAPGKANSKAAVTICL
jgi:hypothetical protein